MSPGVQRLRRSVADRWVGGVCGGIAEYLGLDPTLVRVVYVLLAIFSAAFPGILVYLVLWFLIPEREYY
jgi:phage shock protein C